MKLLYQSHSPYARKVLVFAHEIGLANRLDVIHHETSPVQHNDDVFALNPLGKVPVLVCDDQTVLFDSNVICEYLDGLHEGRKLFPLDPPLRFRVLRNQAIATGLADAGIAVRWESERRPESVRWPPLLEGHLHKVIASCDYLEHNMPDDTVDIGSVALATALDWIAFRDVYAFQQGRPRLSAWYSRFCSHASMLATSFHGDTVDQPPVLPDTSGAPHAIALG